MSFAQVLEELPAFSVEQRQLLVRRALELEETPLSLHEEKMVETRLAAHRKDPSSSLPLNEFKARLDRRPAKRQRAMSHKDITHLLEGNPFVPFRLHLTDGKTYDIQHRDFVWVFPTRLEIAIPSKQSEGLMERAEFVSLLHIVRIEQLKQAA